MGTDWNGERYTFVHVDDLAAAVLLSPHLPVAAKGPSGINRSICAVTWVDRVVPFTVELGTGDIDGIHLVVGQSDTLRIGIGIQFAVDLQPGVGRGGADQINDDTVADQRLSPPVLGDE